MSATILQRLWRASSPEHVQWVPASSEYFASRPHLLARAEVPSFLSGSEVPEPFIHNVRASASIVSFFDDGPRLSGERRRWGPSIYSSARGGADGVQGGAGDQRVELAIASRNTARFDDYYAERESEDFIRERLGGEWFDAGRSVLAGLDELGIDTVVTGLGYDNAWAIPRDLSIIRVVHDGTRPQVVPMDPGSWAWRNRGELGGAAALAGVSTGALGALHGAQAMRRSRD